MSSDIWAREKISDRSRTRIGGFGVDVVIRENQIRLARISAVKNQPCRTMKALIWVTAHTPSHFIGEWRLGTEHIASSGIAASVGVNYLAHQEVSVPTVAFVAVLICDGF